MLECFVEAFPESLCYWERADGRSIDSFHKAYLRDQGKYKVISNYLVVLPKIIKEFLIGKKKVHMTLNLTILNPNSDYGRYYCVSKNEEGITRGEIEVYGKFIFIR